MFSAYPAGLDANNTNNGSNGKYAVAELMSDNTEVPYPSVEYNSPPGGAIDYSMTPPTGKSDLNHFLGVQSVIVDSSNTLWVLDTGRAIDPISGALVTAKNPGGTKLISIDLATNRVTRTITFPPTVAYPDSVSHKTILCSYGPLRFALKRLRSFKLYISNVRSTH